MIVEARITPENLLKKLGLPQINVCFNIVFAFLPYLMPEILFLILNNFNLNGFSVTLSHGIPSFHFQEININIKHKTPHDSLFHSPSQRASVSSDSTRMG